MLYIYIKFSFFLPFIEHIFTECLLCAKHFFFFDTGETMGNKTNVHRTYILMGEGQNTQIKRDFKNYKL